MLYGLPFAARHALPAGLPGAQPPFLGCTEKEPDFSRVQIRVRV